MRVVGARNTRRAHAQRAAVLVGALRATFSLLDRARCRGRAPSRTVCVFFVSTCICLFKLFSVAGQSHSDVLHTSAVSMLKYVAVQFVFSIPILLDIYQQSTDGSIEMHDDMVGWHIYEVFGAACTQIVATAQVLQVGGQIARLRAHCRQQAERPPNLTKASSESASARGSVRWMMSSSPSTYFRASLLSPRSAPSGSLRAAGFELSELPTTALAVRNVPLSANI